MNEASTIEHCRADRNGGTGIATGVGGGIIRDSVARYNKYGGIGIYNGQAHDNVSLGNGTGGFYCDNCSLQGNLSESSHSYGVVFTGSNNAWGGNQILFSTTAPTIGTAVTLAPNACGTSVCP